MSGLFVALQIQFPKAPMGGGFDCSSDLVCASANLERPHLQLLSRAFQLLSLVRLIPMTVRAGGRAFSFLDLQIFL